MENKVEFKEILYPMIGGKYKHYKGGYYEVIGMANHSETGEAMVVYKSLLFGGVYVRPLKMWFETVKIEKQKFINLKGFEEEFEYKTPRFSQVFVIV